MQTTRREPRLGHGPAEALLRRRAGLVPHPTLTRTRTRTDEAAGGNVVSLAAHRRRRLAR